MALLSDSMSRPKSPNSLDACLLRRMRASKGGKVFTPATFLDLGSRAGIDQALSRLVKTGQIRRAGRGLYDLERPHPWFGTLRTDPANAAAALATARGQQLRPGGAEAANLLGLSEQVPAKLLYFTDGPSRKMELAGQTVEFLHRSARQMAMTPQPTGLIAAALKSLGAARITEARLERLRRDLSAADRATLKREMPLAPAWMHRWFLFLAEKVTSPSPKS